MKLSKDDIKELIAEAIKKNNEQNGISGDPSNVPSIPNL